MTTAVRLQARRVLEIEAATIRSLCDGLDDSFDRAVALMKDVGGRVVVTGIGKSGIVGQKIAATLASTGTAAFFLHPAEAIHGDLGMILPGDVVLEMSRKRLGITGVVDASGALAGVVSDGDLRRLLERIGEGAWRATAKEAMNPSPRTISGGAFATEALSEMEKRKITSLFVLSPERLPEGILHLHDLWGIESI